MSVFSHTGRRVLQGLLLCIAVFLEVSLSQAQAVRPVIAEYIEKARGRFDLVNDSLIPLNVILEAKSFSITEDGSPQFRPMDREIHLKLSQKSFRIPPRQTYYVFYEATAPHYPAWFVIYASISGLPQQSGLNVQIELPHTVYMQQKLPMTKDQVQISRAEFLPQSKRVELELRNLGDRFARVSEVEVRADREKLEYPGFPLMPGSLRRVVIDWKSGVAPQRAIVQFKSFKVEIPLEERRN